MVQVDAEQFDALARSLQMRGHRRGAFGAIVAALSGVAVGLTPAEAKKRRRAHGSPNDGRCTDCADRSIARSAHLEGCDLSHRDLSGADLRSASLDRACLQYVNLTGANLRSADLEGADVSGANLTDANLERADIRNWKTDGAIFCRTTMPDGSVNTVNCLPGGGATCLGLNQLCSFVGGTPCCHYGHPGSTTCDGTIPFITACQAKCRSDVDCQNIVGSPDVICLNDPLSDFGCAGRNFDPNVHCCARKACNTNSDCQTGLCCQITRGDKTCCLPGERCGGRAIGCIR